MPRDEFTDMRQIMSRIRSLSKAGRAYLKVALEEEGFFDEMPDEEEQEDADQAPLPLAEVN